MASPVFAGPLLTTSRVSVDLVLRKGRVASRRPWLDVPASTTPKAGQALSM